MVNLLQSIRGFVGFILFVISVFMTFGGFPGALLSWLGGGVVTMGYTVAIATITHEDIGQGKEGAGARFGRICIAFAIASLGAALRGAACTTEQPSVVRSRQYQSINRAINEKYVE